VKGLTRTGTAALWVAVLLVVLAPLPEGSAYPWALSIIEAAVFGLVAIWQLAIAFGKGQATAFSRGRALALPVLLFVALVTVQLAPMPPAVLRAVSPATYRLYELSLPGWPHERSQETPAAQASAAKGSQWSLLPTVNEVAGGTMVPFAPAARLGDRRQSGNPVAASGAWRSLSIAPSMTRAVLLEVAAYAALFFLILLYPFGTGGVEAERAVYRAIMSAALLSGLIVAVVGIVEFFAWNGKVLWLFVPYDWGKPQPGELARAIGPFVNPDHFGDYLALVLPLAAGSTLFRSDLFSKSRAFRVFSAVTAFLIVCALLLSLSRGAWIASAIALAVLFGLSERMPQTARPPILRIEHGALLRWAGVLALSVIALSLLFIGPQGRRQVDLRLQQTVYNDSGFGGRLELAADTLAMARDYPVLGVGLGCWPELFPHYRRPPWAALIYREAHNDYAQLLAESGILGLALVAWLLVAIGRRLCRRLANDRAGVSPTLASVCAALTVIAFHEFFDFSLHTPANAVLFTVLLALAVRMADGPGRDAQRVPPSGLRLRVAAGCVSAAAAMLVVWALKQEKIPYPRNIKPPVSEAGAVTLISAHPAESAPHLDLVRLGGEQLSSRQRLDELRAAVWLDPTNPYARDVYARALLQQGMTAQALDDITRSVADSPSLSTHFYLNQRLIPWLSVSERQAAEQGFKEAIERRYEGAVQGFADFYSALGEFADAAEIYRNAAKSERDPDTREGYLVGAGVSYARAGDLDNAQKFLKSATRNDPTDVRSYEYLATMVYGPLHQLKAAQNVVAQGVHAGANGVALYEALADAAQTAGDAQVTEIALRDAVDSQPAFSSLMRLGMFYLNKRKYDRAALSLRRATEANPGSADAYFYLGVAEESDYRFSDAERDLSRAVQLAPANAGYRAHYLDFEHKVARGIKASKSVNE
jgi:O-antigen ligase/tetratricopeptide (TPR) repeat protein